MADRRDGPVQRQRELSNQSGEREVMASAVMEVEGETVFYCNRPYIYEGQTFSY
jgi:hypothetical protein